MVVSASAMASSRATWVRAAKRRKRVFSLLKTNSIGLKSGEYGGQEDQLATGGVNQRPDVGPFMDTEVVEDHDRARRQRGEQELPDVGGEGIAVHGSQKRHRGLETGRRERRNQGGVLSVVARRGAVRALAAGSPRIRGGQADIGAGFVQEDEAARVAVGEGGAPLPAGGVAPLGGCQRLFFRVQPRR
jgi:hypothetical protein